MTGTGCILVCVTRQVSCERLIRRGSDLAHQAGAALDILHVAANGTNLLGNPSEGEALDYLFTTAKEHGAELSVLRNDNVAETIARIAREHHAQAVILGESRQNSKEDGGVIWQLRALLPDVPVHIIASLE